MPRNALRLSLVALPTLLAACASTPEPAAPTAVAEAVKVTPLQETAPAPRVHPQPFRADAPQSYTVKRGDTLWGLAQRFLNDPWRWPQIWHANPQVRNPHRIYPGDVLTIVTINGQPRLTKRLTPQVRILPQEQAIPTLPLAILRPFLTYPQILEAAELNSAPQVVGSPDGRLVLGRGDSFYAHGGTLEQGQTVAVVRPHKPLRDAKSEEVLGYEAEAAGTARVLKSGETSTLQLIESPRETRRGDRLVPLPQSLAQDLQLSPAPDTIKGRVVSLPDATTISARWQVVAIDRGRADGLTPGHVIRLHKPGQTTRLNTAPIPDPRGESGSDDPFAAPVRDLQLPDEVLGDAVVFLVYERISYALLSEVSQPVRVGDCFASPTAAATRCR